MPLLATGSGDKTVKLSRLGSVINFILAESAFLFGFQKNLLNLYSVFSTINSALDKIKKPTHYLLSYDYREKKSGISRILDGIDPEKKIKLPDHLDHHTRLLMITRARMCAMFVQKLLINYTTGPPIDIFKFATAILSRRRLPPPPRENTLQGHSDFIFSLAFHPTAPLLATGGRDKTAKLWHLSSDNSSVTCLATLGGHRDSVNSVAFHPTAPLFAIANYNSIQLFEISKLLLRIKPAPQGGGLITRHHKKRLSRKVKRHTSKRIKKNVNINRNKYRKSKKAKAKTKTQRYRKFR